MTTQPPTMDTLFHPDDLRAALDAGLVTRRRHAELPLSVYTYTRTCVFANVWSPVTIHCRGLVVEDDTRRIVGRCLPKFFNHEEHARGDPFAPPLPERGFEILTKEDGSLGHLFHYADRWQVTTKGAFTSPQAQWAMDWLAERDPSALDPTLTYVTEIIHPANRIIVDNGSERTLVLLAVLTPDGTELPLPAHAPTWTTLGGRVVRSHPGTHLTDLIRAATTNHHLDGTPATGDAAEGWVIRYPTGLRAKVKLTDYTRLQKLFTGLTERDIWRYLGMQRFTDRDPAQVARALRCHVDEVTAHKTPFTDLLDSAPDELDTWIRTVATHLTTTADTMESLARTTYANAPTTTDHPTFATYAKSQPDPHLTTALFLLNTNRDIALPTWTTLKPPAGVAFGHEAHGRGGGETAQRAPDGGYPT